MQHYIILKKIYIYNIQLWTWVHTHSEIWYINIKKITLSA